MTLTSFLILSEERRKPEKKCFDYLDSENTAVLKDFSEFLDFPESWVLPTTTEKHDSLPHRVKDVLPSILYARLANISAYSEWVEGPYVSVGEAAQAQDCCQRIALYT